MMNTIISAVVLAAVAVSPSAVAPTAEAHASKGEVRVAPSVYEVRDMHVRKSHEVRNRHHPVRAMRMDAAREAHVSRSRVRVVSVEQKVWPDVRLGLAERDEMCTMALVDGYRIRVNAGGPILTYRTNHDGRNVRLEK